MFGIDRKTATKHLNKLLRREKEQELDSKQKSRLEQKIHAARINLNYTIYYPLTEKYVSLYPKEKGKSDEKGGEAAAEPEQQNQDGKPPVWEIVEKCMEEGTLDRLREGQLNIGADGKPTAPSTAPAAKSSSKKSNKRPESNDPEPSSRRERRAKTNGTRDRQTWKDYGQGRERLQDIPAAPVEDDSDGGFFEEG